MTLLEKAQHALALIQEGREALATIAEAAKDAAGAITVQDQEKLNRMLEEERVETRKAYDNLQNAIAMSRM